MSLNNYGYCVHCRRTDTLLWPSKLQPGFFTCCDEVLDEYAHRLMAAQRGSSTEARQMQLRVLHEDGRVEVLTLSGEWRFVEGEHLNKIMNAYGREYFFTHDGFYDGWGMEAKAKKCVG